MNRPRIEIETTLLTKVLRLSVYGLLLASILVLLFFYNQLPDKVPIYFNWPTKEQGLGSKNILWAAPLILGIGSLVLLSLARRPWILNYPTRITEKNAKKQYHTASIMLRLLSLLIAFTCLALTIGSVTSYDNRMSQIIESVYRLLPYLFFGLPLFFVFKLAFSKEK
jgi:Na+/proline symporter